jgi:hypothetical protein
VLPAERAENRDCRRLHQSQVRGVMLAIPGLPLLPDVGSIMAFAPHRVRASADC